MDPWIHSNSKSIWENIGSFWLLLTPTCATKCFLYLLIFASRMLVSSFESSFLFMKGNICPHLAALIVCFISPLFIAITKLSEAGCFKKKRDLFRIQFWKLRVKDWVAGFCEGPMDCYITADGIMVEVWVRGRDCIVRQEARHQRVVRLCISTLYGELTRVSWELYYFLLRATSSTTWWPLMRPHLLMVPPFC